MPGLPDVSAALNIISWVRGVVSSDTSDVTVSLAGEQLRVERQKERSWGPVSMPPNIAPVSFQFTNVGEAGAYLQSMYTGDPDADLQAMRGLTSVDGGEDWVIPPGSEAVVESFDVGFNPRMQTTTGRSGEFLDMEFYFTFQDRAAVTYERSVKVPIYITPLPDLQEDQPRT